MLALWALFLLSAMIITWALEINSQIVLSGNASRVVEAEAMASSGAEVALDPDVEPRSALLHRSLARNQSYQARILGEGGRLHLNWILSGEDPNRLAVLRNYLEVKGVDINERDRMMDCLLDFVDPDDLPRLNGAESGQNYSPQPHPWFGPCHPQVFLSGRRAGSLCSRVLCPDESLPTRARQRRRRQFGYRTPAIR